MSILITAASHAEAYKLARILKDENVVYADHQPLTSVAFANMKFLPIPSGSSSSYAHEMLNLALDAGVSTIYPLYEAEIEPLAEARQLFAEYGISVMVPSILWLRKSLNSINHQSSGELYVLENGRVISGTLPSGLFVPEDDLTGVFQLHQVAGSMLFKLFTV